jgi:hypothetical protein
MKPLRPHLSDPDYTPHARAMHLFKILLARHGIEAGGF